MFFDFSRLVKVLGLSFFCLAATDTFASEKRMALVIGNSDYSHVSVLPNATNDANDLADALTRIGFDVTNAANLSYREMRLAIRDFANVASDANVVLVYFAGHGIEIDNTNYLIPVNAALQSDRDIEFEAIRLDAIVNAVSVANGLKVVLVDACRNNPFLTNMARTSATRSIGRGLGRVDPGGVLVGYAARAGTLALDGDGRNSPYAQALLTHIEEPGLEIGRLFRKVRASVLELTGGYQEPFTYGSLPDREIYLVPAALTAQPKETAVSVPTEVDSPLVLACDRLASDPDDTTKPVQYTGVSDDEIDLNAALPACTIAVAGHPNHARSLYNLARAEKLSDEINASLVHYRKASDLGHALAKTKLGELLLQSGKDSLVSEGIELFNAEAQGGNSVFAKILGDHFSGTTGSSRQNLEKALLYYKIAANAGDPDAMFQVGHRLYSNSQSAKDQKAQGLEFLERSAQAGYVPAQIRLATEYLAENRSELRAPALQLLEAAATSGDTYAQRRLVEIYYGKDGFEKDTQRYAFWVLALADSGEKGFNVEAGWNYEVGRGVDRNAELAAKYYYAALSTGEELPLERATRDWDSNTAKEMQKLLSFYWEARYAGPIDGVIGRDTLKAMQRACGCSPQSRSVVFSNLFAQ
ncbi:caspase family protein [Ruegeria arenilitoris]|uniref:caspase family protein n=1 Tax=Ruegeria arenilitoris TaxID=1173585 RepID=UPI00147E27A0|nr:caspase family protein [Ruegeria arenilitoris]